MTTENVSTSVLRDLHRIHRQLTDLRERLARGPKQVRAAETHVAHCENQLAAVEAETKALRVATDAKQVQLKGGEDKKGKKIGSWIYKNKNGKDFREYPKKCECAGVNKDLDWPMDIS